MQVAKTYSLFEAWCREQEEIARAEGTCPKILSTGNACRHTLKEGTQWCWRRHQYGV